MHTEVLRVVVRHGARAGRRSPQDAADLTQEVMVAMFDRNARELRRWDPERGLGFEGFVRLVARRRVARTLARQRGNSRVVVPVEPSTVEQHPDVTGARRVEVRGQLEQVLRRLQPKMSVRDRTLFELLYVEEHEPAVVARRMAMTRGAVNAWSYRLRKLATAVA
ncbi:MAG: sigma-70 family RNA polymerase sigma factor [Myxococcota bacterium]